MIDLNRVLLPTDFSAYSGEATRYACAMVEQFGAELHLLHVAEFHPSTTPTFGGGLAISTLVRESLETAEKELVSILDADWKKDKRIVRVAIEGKPFLEIIRYARQNEIDLIVMATHGRTGLAHVLMGSVAEKVVRKAPCPVLTVRPGGHQFVMP